MKMESENEITMLGDSLWVTVDNLSIRIGKESERVKISIFNLGKEDEEPIEEIKT